VSTAATTAAVAFMASSIAFLYIAIRAFKASFSDINGGKLT